MTPTPPLFRIGGIASALALLLACGGGGSGGGSSTSPSTATSLGYTDPTTGTYLLKKNAALSTATHLVLDLVGPASTTGTGITATFTADATRVAWANVAAGDPANTFVQNGTAFSLGAAPQILKGKVSGGTLQVAVAQKGIASPASLNAPLLRVALDLKAAQSAGAVTLAADSAKCQMIDGTGTIVAPIAVTVGTLSSQ